MFAAVIAIGICLDTTADEIRSKISGQAATVRKNMIWLSRSGRAENDDRVGQDGARVASGSC